jgi:GTPase Era involved in 16S rRNA processing
MDYLIYNIGALPRELEDTTLLTPDEQQAAVQRGGNYALFRTLLRHELSRRTGLAAKDISIRYSEHGKPECDVQPFNLSHSGDCLCLAFHHKAVGVDVERIRPRKFQALAERFMCAEIVREKVLWTMQEEIPHGVAVDIESFKTREKNGKELIDIGVVIICEKDSHKGMIIGKGGEKLKTIGSLARKDMEELLQAKVNLQCFVKVKEDWRNRERFINDMGLADE